MQRTLQALLASVVIGLGVGCERAEPLQWISSETVAKLSPELRTEVREVLRKNCGTYSDPLLMGQEDANARHLSYGQQVYQKRCVQCHGVSGDGNGPVADSMYPRPRDYRKGIFKFTTTPYGSRPRRHDLVRTVTRGIPGTSMPSFKRLPEKDIQSVIDYVLVLTRRGELELSLGQEAELEGQLDPEFVEEYINDIKTGWKQAEYSEINPITPRPEFTAEMVELGRKAFLSKGCSKCHGEDGRGHTKDNIGKDSWGFPTRAADLTSGMLHGGSQPIDVYRRVHSGINGTPMPGSKGTLRAEPETIWHLVSYVLYVSQSRRSGTVPPAGLLKPYVEPGASSGGSD